MSVSQQDWVAFAKVAVLMPAMGLAILYFLEYKGSLEKANAVIWKRPKRWQLITLGALWAFIIAGALLLHWLHR